MSKFRKFLDKHAWSIIAVITIVAVIGALAFFLVDANRNIDDQIKSLYEKELIVERDLSKLSELSGASYSVFETKTVVVFTEKECSLEITYNKSGEILTKKFTDSRIGSNPIGLIGVLILIAFLSAAVSTLLILALDTTLGKYEIRKLNKEAVKSEHRDIDH